MRKVNPRFGLKKLCDLFGKTRQAYYETNWHNQDRIMEYEIILKYVKEFRQGPLEKLGTEKLLLMLQKPLEEHKIRIGRDRLFDLLAAHGMLIRRRKKRKFTTDSKHLFRKHPYLVKDIIPDSANHIWVADITYISLIDGFSYLSIVTDAYSRKIMGYCLWETLESIGPLKALQMAITVSEKKYLKLIHHSDRGIQYCCHEYIKVLTSNQMLISMTENGDPYQNALAERVNGILKEEMGLNKVFSNHIEAEEATDKCVEAYNNVRPHLSCNYLTPNQAYLHEGPLEKKWKNYYKPILKKEANEH